MSFGARESDWRQALYAGRFEDAHKLYLMADAPDPEVRRALSALADIVEFVREKSWPRASRRLQRLEEKPPLVDWTALEAELDRLAESSRSLDRMEPEEAMALLEGEAVAWFPAEAANLQGTARIYSGDPEAARQDFRRAVELDPRHYRALTNLGNAALEAGEVDEAIACYERALAVNDDFANAHHNLGVAYRRKGQVGRSVRQLRRAQRVQQRSERERAREGLGEGPGKGGLKILRWVLYALVALTLVAILRGRGFL
ncbi:MAG: tetratricopeptide repeat protein [Trueperaceae bacterium]